MTKKGKFFKVIIVTLLSLAFGITLSEGTTDKIKVDMYDFGIYEFVTKEVRINDPSTNAGYRSYVKTVKGIELVEQTNKIPLKKGILFGYRVRFYNVSDGPSFRIDIRYEHPLIIKKDGEKSTGFTKENGQLKEVNGSYYGGVLYRLSEDFELVPGNWKFDVIYQGNVIATKTFIVH